MRKALLASATLLGLAVAVPGFAQTTTNDNMPATDAAPMATDNGAAGATMDKSMPMKPHRMHRMSSNNTSMDTRSVIAPALPVPPLGPNSSPEQYLTQAQMALHHRRTGEAQEALERAETRMLDRSTTPGAAATPDMAPMIGQITQARDALGRHDWKQADQLIADMLNSPHMASAGSGMGGAASMNKGAGMNGTMGSGNTDMNSDMANPPPGSMPAQPMTNPNAMAPAATQP